MLNPKTAIALPQVANYVKINRDQRLTILIIIILGSLVQTDSSALQGVDRDSFDRNCRYTTLKTVKSEFMFQTVVIVKNANCSHVDERSRSAENFECHWRNYNMISIMRSSVTTDPCHCFFFFVCNMLYRSEVITYVIEFCQSKFYIMADPVCSLCNGISYNS